MAVRTGAGTGVIVSLVVFILASVFLLILTIVFYAGKTDALEAKSLAEADLAKYVKPQQRNSDLFRGMEQAASAEGQSVAAYLDARHGDVMRFLNGDASVDLAEVKADLTRLGVGDDDVVRHVLEQARRDLRNRQVEADGLREKLASREAELAEKEAQISRMEDDHRQEIELVSRDIVTYRQAGDENREQLRTTIEEMNRARDRLQDQYRDRIADLEDEIDRSNQEVVLLRSRVDEYEELLNNIRFKAQDPALLVDGVVLDVDPSNDQVFIDRGKNDRIVMGMTFEVYDDSASIRVDERSGTLPRGKASLQVVKVGETTSTCKLTRTVRGRPVVRNNVIANAIYDPDYRFKFLVHGKFDVDGDGRPSEAEAQHLRSIVVDWGGEIVIADELPGDLDFLVLGQMPPMPPTLRPDASDAQTRIWVQQRAARQKYEDLFRSASEAQIPVLNANRFLVLIGRTDR
ncbi:MAG: hypothetical protein HKO59_06770 [Phycisphaerales bacterium]|nr:hypothetical protein [Phycisphaerae bacterium]NNF41738.1 hypothetical protein [Phycisphaerales bacterium]NNM25678.1 hypothetical protein [Phycisphaerales bacterium]